MRMLIRVMVTGLFCVSAATVLMVGVFWYMEQPERRPLRTNRPSPDSLASAGLSTPNRPEESETTRGGAIDQTHEFEDGGFGTALAFTGSVHDPGSLWELREAIKARGRLGYAVLKSQLARTYLGSEASREQIMQGGILLHRFGLICMYEGKFDEATASFEKALKIGTPVGMPPQARSEMMGLLGVIALRRGELDNCIACLGPSSCIFPIERNAVHTQQAGSREAVKRFTAYLEEWPDDLRARWLLNIASMTLGEYPDKVPPKLRIPIDAYRSQGSVGRFENMAPTAGLIKRGPNLAGGSIFDDFNGDNLPDLFTTSLDADRGASLLINKGDGTFEDRSDTAGLSDQIYALNVTRADYDNDGDLDVLLHRGGWEKPMRLSLLRNKGDGTFEDVTAAAGLVLPIASESAAWGDYDNDGDLDVFVCGEYLPPSGDLAGEAPDPRNRCRLYRNKGDGTFEDLAATAGVVNERCAKGSAWGDYDNDGRLDLYVSNMNGPSRLYHNEGDGTFRDVAPDLGVTGPEAAFACWFWDFDNDGQLDLYVNENRVTLAETAALALGKPVENPSRPRLYHNLGSGGFRDVTAEVGLDRAMAPMGANFGDVDNDGNLDIYLGTGWMAYSGLVPNLMFQNVDGRCFNDVTISSGTGHLQKGHGVSFADYDGDGDLDVFVEAGGAVPGDKSYNLLFRNPSHDSSSIQVKLVGTRSNRSALGARIRADIKSLGGEDHSIFRTIGNNSSFGGNSLVETIGLRNAKSVAELTVTWPTTGKTQTFHDLPAGEFLEITEGSDVPKLLRRTKPAIETHAARRGD